MWFNNPNFTDFEKVQTRAAYRNDRPGGSPCIKMERGLIEDACVFMLGGAGTAAEYGMFVIKSPTTRHATVTINFIIIELYLNLHLYASINYKRCYLAPPTHPISSLCGTST